jgi:hypothetical protein
VAISEKKFMECCWCLWKANGAELVEPFVEAAFNDLPEKSRAILFQRMLTIVYVAQEIEIKNAIEEVQIRLGTALGDVAPFSGGRPFPNVKRRWTG